MEPGKASQTAILVARYRARGAARDPKWCDDPWADALSGAEGEALARSFDEVQPQLTLWVCVRTAHIDARLEALTPPRGPCGQVVILGAGLDTRAARLAREGVRFFEVDAPETQAHKRARLARLDGYPVGAATYVTCDFEREDFLDRLLAEGFDADRPALIVWEGVSFYLTEPAVRATLGRVARGCHPMTTIVFDHAGKKLVQRLTTDPQDLGTIDRVAGLGEPFRWGTDHVLPLLYEEGFRRVRIDTFDELALNQIGEYERDWRFRFQYVAEASRQAPAQP